jgi:hypothetical protein
MSGDIQSVLLALYKLKGRLDPHDVVELASDPKSALHSRFTWEDDVAAVQWRLQQARQLIRSVTIERVITPDQEPRQVRVWVHDPTTDGYLSVNDIAKQPDVRDRVLDDMRRDLERLKFKWKLYENTFKSLVAEVLAAEPEDGEESVTV